MIRLAHAFAVCQQCFISLCTSNDILIHAWSELFYTWLLLTLTYVTRIIFVSIYKHVARLMSLCHIIQHLHAIFRVATACLSNISELQRVTPWLHFNWRYLSQHVAATNRNYNATVTKGLSQENSLTKH